ncbi:MAG: periplasmic heavy metal sensor [Bacteroidia bacterium]|jgi:hypothetical protein|nr:periplasmic heavy metal sensor [Bacteroidia bacterium]
MNKSKLFVALIVLLLLANVVLLVFAFGDRPGSRERRGALRERIINQLHFDQAQADKYELLIHEHRSTVDAKSDEISQLRRQMYAALKTGDSAANDSLRHEIGKLQIETELVHYNHFKGIRALCRPDQLPAFDTMLPELAKAFSHQKPPRPPQGH